MYNLFNDINDFNVESAIESSMILNEFDAMTCESYAMEAFNIGDKFRTLVNKIKKKNVDKEELKEDLNEIKENVDEMVKDINNETDEDKKEKKKEMLKKAAKIGLVLSGGIAVGTVAAKKLKNKKETIVVNIEPNPVKAVNDLVPLYREIINGTATEINE